MKKVLLLLCCFCYFGVQAQDVIVKTNRKSITCNILKQKGEFIYFKLPTDTFQYQIHLMDIYLIIYEDGTVETFNTEDQRFSKIVKDYYYPEILSDNIISGTAGVIMNSNILLGIVYEKQFSGKRFAFQLPVYYGIYSEFSDEDPIKYYVDPTFIAYPFGQYIYTLGISGSIGLGKIKYPKSLPQRFADYERMIYTSGIGLVFQFNIRKFWVVSFNSKIILTNYYFEDRYDATIQPSLNLGFRF